MSCDPLLLKEGQKQEDLSPYPHVKWGGDYFNVRENTQPIAIEKYNGK
jgi:hypothetical protein